MTKTKEIKTIHLNDKIFNEILKIEEYKLYKDLISKEYIKRKENLYKQEWILFSADGEKGIFSPMHNIAIELPKKQTALAKICFEKRVTLLDDHAVIKLFKNSIPKALQQGMKGLKTFKQSHWIAIKSGSYSMETGQFADWRDDDSIYLNIVPMTLNEFDHMVSILKYKILEDESLNEILEIRMNRAIKELTDIEVDKLVDILDIDSGKVKEKVKNQIRKGITLKGDLLNAYIEELLSCDTTRVELEKYDAKRLVDINMGHWELWDDCNDSEVKAEISKCFIARNPIVDIHENGLIGIDFGTKSTIVSRQDGREKTSLMRIGIGQLNKQAEGFHYENPTVMEFVNLEKFLKDYYTKEGRPKTSINDVTVSHKAYNSLKESVESDLFYSYFYDIKQWCGDTDRKVEIIDQKKKKYTLQPFTTLVEDKDFNPLEIYAYYLGLFINNMRNGIYLDYVLSFPVTYKNEVKEKILESFTKGIRKSLPESILKDENCMSKFRVRQGVSEPAAYAITALLGYGFEPEDDEKVLYAIFDFGGGTTDFDFGVWRAAKDNRDEGRYDYVIEHFGAEGDMYLGGENLLELLAFEVFKANAALIQTGTKKEDGKEKGERMSGFSFSQPKESDEFAGSETLISDSQEAKRNTKQLMEALRPFWEGIVGIENESEGLEGTVTYNGYRFMENDTIKSIVENGEIIVDLFDKDGKRQSGQKLYVKSKPKKIDVDLISILEKRIGRGVENFFSAIQLVFKYNEVARSSKTDCIHIFLAGNSSKSPILRKCFDSRIIEENERIKVKKKTDGEHFCLYPPLGTAEAMEIQREKGIFIDENDIMMPTGKTGVAYGLIAGRDGGQIKVISESKKGEEAKFRFNLGKAKRGKFQITIDRNTIQYGEWNWFVDAGVEDFEIYYTSLPGAHKSDIDMAGIYKQRCRISFTDSESDVYVRAVSPDEIEFAVAKCGSKPASDADVKKVRLEIQ